MKIASTIAGVLLGLLFLMASITFLTGHVPKMDPPPAGSLTALFMGSFGASGWLTFVKVCELIGGLLVLVPKTRNFGLLVLGPIIINILAFHLFIEKGGDLFNPMIIVIVVLAAFLLWAERRKFAGLLR